MHCYYWLYDVHKVNNERLTFWKDTDTTAMQIRPFEKKK